MKLSELLSDLLLRTQLFEMAFAKRVAMDRARDLQFPIAEHLVKIVMYQGALPEAHWIKEVNTWLQRIQTHKLRGTNKPLGEKELFLILFDEPLGTLVDVQDLMNLVHLQHPDLNIVEPDAALVSKKLLWVLSNASREISHKQFKGIESYV